MGSSSSRNAEASQRRYLIGTLNKKSSVEQKFFGLSQLIDLKCTSQSKGLTGNGNNHHVHNDVKAQDRENMDLCITNEATLYKPLPLNKPLYASETFVNWKSHYDIERMQMKLMQRKTAVYLVPIGSFPSFVMDFKLNMSGKVYSLFEILGTFLGIFYQEMPISWLDSVDPEKENWNITTRNHKVTGKRQYLVSDFYPQLKKWKPKNTFGILGLTWTDLYPTESLNFVLGEASKRHRSGVISFGRFEPKTFDPEKSRDIEDIDPIIMWKLLKVSSHELGHLFGLSHCDFFLCGMNGSSSVEEAMLQPLFFCPVCIRKLQYACKFDIVKRYTELRQFLSDLNGAMPFDRFQQCVDLLDRCLDFLLNDHDR